MRTTKKIIQALAYIAYQQPDHKVNSMKAYKLLWLADRQDHYRRCVLRIASWSSAVGCQKCGGTPANPYPE